MTLHVGSLLTDAAAVNPEGTAATLADQQISYRQLAQQASLMTTRLVAQGAGPGRRVLWWSDPDLRSLAGFAAVARSGAVFAPLNPAFGEQEAGLAFEYLAPDLVVAGSGQVELARALAGGRPVVTIDDLASGRGPLAASSVQGAETERSASASASSLDDGAPHIIYLTSGTTGLPKGVVVSHRASWLRSFPGGSTFAAGLRGDGGILPTFPLFHYGGWHYVLEAWHHRCAFHLCGRFDGPSLVEAAERWRPTAMYCIPAVWNRVLEVSPNGAGLESVRHADTGTSAAPPELLERLGHVMPDATTSVLYGSSEGGHHTTLHHRDVASRPGSVGKVAPPGVIQLSPEGEILYRSATLMDGYLHRPAETADALRDGWYHTGDLGSFDDDGFLYITGRAKEVIRTGGETVAPAEVEAALRGLPGVSDLAVVGIPHEQWGEVVCAAVVALSPDATPNVTTVRGHIESRLAAFKHPRLVVSVEAIPRTPATGQVQRTLLRDMVLQKL